MESDSSIGRGYVVIGLTEHGVDTVQCQILAEELMGHPVYLQQTLQLLIKDREKNSNWNNKNTLSLSDTAITFTNNAFLFRSTQSSNNSLFENR